ncbi:MAG: hypothetical protein WC835_02150 [Candidatus Paceibacterota bacterium]|jgi:hypothetical protein
MKVCFACSTSELKSRKNTYRKICGLIKELGHAITRDWLEEAIQIVEKNNFSTLDREEVYNKVVGSILASDVMIIEGTVASFSVGHQVTLALSKNKPTLFLIQRKTASKKQGKSKNSFLTGITSPLLKVAEYDDSNLADILNDFLNNNGGRPVVKFNIVLTKEIENYLNWASFTHKLNKSEFIRNLILKHMKNDDKQYQKYSSHNPL